MWLETFSRRATDTTFSVSVFQLKMEVHEQQRETTRRQIPFTLQNAKQYQYYYITFYMYVRDWVTIALLHFNGILRFYLGPLIFGIGLPIFSNKSPRTPNLN